MQGKVKTPQLVHTELLTFADLKKYYFHYKLLSPAFDIKYGLLKQQDLKLSFNADTIKSFDAVLKATVNGTEEINYLNAFALQNSVFENVPSLRDAIEQSQS